MNTGAVIKLSNVSKFYRLYDSPRDRLKEALHPLRKRLHKPFRALNDIHVEISRGEIFGVVGRNGAGKSTLLKIVCNVIRPTAGSLQVNGNISALLELGSGFNPDFTGIENVYFYGSLIGFSKQEMDAKIDDILSFADIGDFVYQPVRSFSSGMTARLAFAVAINIDPQILIVDEILAVGDALFQRKCYARIEQFMKEGKTILFVSHSVPTINALCTRAILLDKGELILEGPPALVTNQYEKLLYAEKENALNVRNEIVAMNRDGALKKAIDKEPAEKEKLKALAEEKQLDPEETKPNDGKIEPLQKKVAKHAGAKPCFIPDFKPKSTVEYRNDDVDIYDVHMRTLDGERVNSLVMEESYIYSYKVRFNTDAENIIFGMKLKTIKGLEIEGACQPGMPGTGDYFPKVSKGDEYTIDWKFRCFLVPGHYYTNAGVSSVADGKQRYLTRLVDCMVFRVQEISDRQFGGLVHLYEEAIITRTATKPTYRQ